MVNENRLADFTSALEILKTLINQGKAFIILPGMVFLEFFPPSASIRILDDETLKSLLTKKGLSLETFRFFIGEVPRLITVCLDGQQKSHIEESSRHWKEPNIEAEKKFLEQKLKSIEELITIRIKEAWEFKKHSKANFFSDFAWDIKVKLFDSESENQQPLVLASCQISYGVGAIRFIDSRDSVEINCTEIDIDFLIKVLTTVKEKIEITRKTGGLP